MPPIRGNRNNVALYSLCDVPHVSHHPFQYLCPAPGSSLTFPVIHSLHRAL